MLNEVSQDKIKLFIVDRDPILRLGLRTAIVQYDDFTILGEGDISNQTFRELTQGLVLNVLLVGISTDSQTAETTSLEFCQQFCELYPQLPILILLPGTFSTRKIAKIKQLGIRGYCHRNSSINTIIEALYSVAYGNLYWQDTNTEPSPQLWQKVLGRLSQSGRIELATTLSRIETQLANRDLSDWERVFLVGRKRELLAARWLSNRLVAEEMISPEDASEAIEPTDRGELIPIPETILNPLPVFADSANRRIFERVVTDIQLGLINKTDFLLEIDILQPVVQKKLCHRLLEHLSDTVAKIPIADTLEQNYRDYLQSLWSWAIEDFFGQHYGQLSPTEAELLQIALADNLITVEENILADIYGIPDLMGYLLGKPGLKINSVNYQADASEAIARIEFLLHNLIIHLANGVMQVILNNFYDLEIFKAKIFRSEYQSDRAIARFRNQISWKYRQAKYFNRPQDIFESRHLLYVLNSGKIRTLYIYASRKTELETLTGLPWLTTIAIETRDASAPLVRKLIAYAGSAVVFVLTQVIGKGLGLIGKGIIQGIGSTLKDVQDRPRDRRKP